GVIRGGVLGRVRRLFVARLGDVDDLPWTLDRLGRRRGLRFLFLRRSLGNLAGQRRQVHEPVLDVVGQSASGLVVPGDYADVYGFFSDFRTAQQVVDDTRKDENVVYQERESQNGRKPCFFRLFFMALPSNFLKL